MYYTNKSTITVLESCFQIVYIRTSVDKTAHYYMANTIVVLRGVIIVFKMIKNVSLKVVVSSLKFKRIQYENKRKVL